MGQSRRSTGQVVRTHLATALSIALAAPLLSSCGSGDVECEIDPVFTDAEQQQIRQAATDWNIRASRQIRFASDADWLIIPASVPLGLGLEEGKRRLIRISPQTPHDQVYAVALHELGHALGLRHVSKGVMDPVRQTIVFSDEDMAECRHAGACP